MKPKALKFVSMFKVNTGSEYPEVDVQANTYAEAEQMTKMAWPTRTIKAIKQSQYNLLIWNPDNEKIS